jgi:hypothetical protein
MLPGQTNTRAKKGFRMSSLLNVELDNFGDSLSSISGLVEDFDSSTDTAIILKICSCFILFINIIKKVILNFLFYVSFQDPVILQFYRLKGNNTKGIKLRT